MSDNLESKIEEAIKNPRNLGEGLFKLSRRPRFEDCGL